MPKRVVCGVATLAAAVLLCSCGGDDNGIVNTIVLTRGDGSKLTVDGPVEVACKRLGGDGPRAVHVMVGKRVPSAPRSFWEAEIAPAQFVRKRTFTFPSDDVGGYPFFFALDVERGENELSSSTEEATGHITFRHADCSTVDFEIDAHLDSELFEQPGIDVAGRVAAPGSG
jgi:hypothetical protein